MKRRYYKKGVFKMASASFSITAKDKELFLAAYREYVAKSIENGDTIPPQSHFFMKILNSWIDKQKGSLDVGSKSN